MGLLDNLGSGMVGKLAGQLGSGTSQNNRLIGAAAKLISSGNVGGLGGLMQMFSQHGHADTVNSWVSTERNRAISPNEVQDVLGQDNVRQVADEAGVSEQEASNGLADILPQLVDKMTPNGKVPEGDNANGMLSQLASHFLGGQQRH